MPYWEWRFDAKNNDGFTPLYIASQKCHLDIVKLLIKSKAQVNIKSVYGNTPIHIAAVKGHVEVVKCLVENGALLDSENKNGETSLSLAIKNEKQPVVDYLTARAENEIPKETYSNKDPCVICWKPKNQLFVLLPCGHTSLCEPCCIKLKLEPYSKCPSCRKVIKSYQKIFFQ